MKRFPTDNKYAGYEEIGILLTWLRGTCGFDCGGCPVYSGCLQWWDITVCRWDKGYNGVNYLKRLFTNMASSS